jgi:hypothetical protein
MFRFSDNLGRVSSGTASREKHHPQQQCVVKVYAFRLGDSEEGQCRAGVTEIPVALKLKRLHHRISFHYSLY